jgi:hypothetical protein
MVLLGIGVSTSITSAGPLIAALALALVTWLLLWALGVVISAQGQLLKASIDGAVNTSPFLVDDQRAKIMSLI